MMSQERHGVSNHQQLNFSFNSLCRLTTEKSLKLTLLALGGEGNPPITTGFPSQMISTAESVSQKGQEYHFTTWWRHQMETFSALLAICAGDSQVIGEFPAQRPVMRSFDIFFDLCLNKRLSKQPWGWWFETPSHTVWRHSGGTSL